jgi:hypothetical protein
MMDDAIILWKEAQLADALVCPVEKLHIIKNGYSERAMNESIAYPKDRDRLITFKRSTKWTITQ